MAIVPGGGTLGSRFTRFVYTDAYGAERETHGALLAVNRRESNREGIVLCADDTGNQMMCLVRENDDGVVAWVRWVDRVPGKEEGWHTIGQPNRAVQDGGWTDVLVLFVVAGILLYMRYVSGNL